MDARALTRGGAGYPSRLNALTNPPERLWVSGPWTPAGRAVAIVGARAASGRSLELAREMGFAVAQSGADVISGGALGVDAAAHRGALDADGVTVAVLGTGIDVVYPERHAALFGEIRRRGALVTEFAPGSGVRRGQFPARNRLIAALGEVVVVVEAQADSGSLHTARAARTIGRRLCAVPGSPGTDGLIVDGAVPVTSAADVMAVLEGRPLAPPALPADSDARRLYEALDRVPRDLGELAFRAGLAASTCAALAIDLELEGLATRAAGGRYVRLR